MTPSYAVRLEFPPTVNTYYRRAGNKIYLSPSGRRFKEDSPSTYWRRSAR